MDFELYHVAQGQKFKPRLIEGIDMDFSSLFEDVNHHWLLNFANEKNKSVGARLLPDNFIIGDSGGLQNAKFGLDFDPVEVSEWYNDNVDYGLCLDKIPIERDEDTGSKAEFNLKSGDVELFKKCASKTQENVEQMIKVQGDYELLNIHQGQSWDSLSVWAEHSDMSLGEGVAMKQWNDCRVNAAILAYAWKHYRGRPIHFLGVGSVTRYLPLILLAKHWGARVTADSASYTWVSRGRTYWSDPHSHGSYHVKKEDARPYGGELPCDCPYCEVIAEYPDGLVEDLSGDERSVMVNNLLMAHNIWVEERRCRYYKKLVKNEQHFLEHCKRTVGRLGSDKQSTMDKWKVVDLVEFVLDLVHEGFDYVNRNYRFGQETMSEWF